MATLSLSRRNAPPLELDKDISRILKLIDTLQEKNDNSLPKQQLETLREVLLSSFFKSVKDVYEHVYNTVDIAGNTESLAMATAKATVAAFAASEGQGHPRMVELDKTDEGFGFNVMGGKEQKCPIYISRIIAGGYADRCVLARIQGGALYKCCYGSLAEGANPKQGGLLRGDQLLSVNGESLEEAAHEKAIDLLKGAAGKVKLVVKYSPKILEEMEQRFEHSKSFRRGRTHSSRK